ncbi:Eukaryotic translation initiation factor 5 [Toxocara canis]|uniref:Eukaryotic translation initiation factor 5 n=1 Tax=Toxocara canis TaxID=6265 RepID=A0A0B2VPW1_TOXCA|nr:Eukaryotic translation initiation factor 5 [Toxocara canis]
MSININRNVLDPFYRYKMPRLQAKVEGKGNGIKTVIANMTEIAKALERPPTYPTKYFGCELGAQTNFDMKNERFIVNGEHDAAKLQDILDGFIKKFVLCPACENPETTLSVRKGQIHSKCKACGNSSIIDPKHKLSTFIMKNPPKNDDKEKKENGGSTPEEGVIDGEILSDKDMNGSGSDDLDDDWAEPMEDAAGQVSAQIGKLIISKDLEKPVEERLDMLHQYFLKAKADGTLQDSKSLLNEAERLELKSKATILLANVLFDTNVVSQIKEYRTLLLRFTVDDHKDSKSLLNEAERLELKSKATILLANVLFDTNVVSQIKEYRTLLLRFTVDDHKAQRHLLGGIEQLIAEHVDTLLPKSAHIIKALYDNDVIEEEVLLAWGEKPSKKYVKKKFCEEIINKAMPVLEWLKNAEEDESSEEEDEDGAVEFDDRARRVGTVDADMAPKANGIMKENEKANEVKVEVENGEELDIDDI